MGSQWFVVPSVRSASDGGGVSSTRPDMTTAHLAQSVGFHLGHLAAHLMAALHPKSPDDRQFNLEHALVHQGEAQDHLERLMEHLRQHYPGVAAELDRLLGAEVLGA